MNGINSGYLKIKIDNIPQTIKARNREGDIISINTKLFGEINIGFELPDGYAIEKSTFVTREKEAIVDMIRYVKENANIELKDNYEPENKLLNGWGTYDDYLSRWLWFKTEKIFNTVSDDDIRQLYELIKDENKNVYETAHKKET